MAKPGQRVAIIGSGLAGLTCAYLLRNDFKVTLFEREAGIGMSAHGYKLKQNGKEYEIDFPHRVINLRYYTQLSAFFRHLNISLRKEDYSLSVCTSETRDIFFGWRNYWFGNKSFPFFNIQSLVRYPKKYLRMLVDAYFFFSQGREDLASGLCKNLTTGEYFEYLIKAKGFSEYFINECILAALAVVGTCTYDSIRAMPADITVRYITTGNFSLTDKQSGVRRPVGGVPAIVNTLAAHIPDIRVSHCIQYIYKRQDGKVIIKDQRGNEEAFDHVIFATQANQALSMIKDPTPEQIECLSSFTHEKTTLVLHTDRRVMPKDEAHWTAFNIMLDPNKPFPMASLWMNRNRRDFDSNLHHIFQTVNPIIDIPKDRILHSYTFERPIMDMKAIKALSLLDKINGIDCIWFIGAYSVYGMPLLESAVISAFKVAEKMGVRSKEIESVNRLAAVNTTTVGNSRTNWIGKFLCVLLFGCVIVIFALAIVIA